MNFIKQAIDNGQIRHIDDDYKGFELYNGAQINLTPGQVETFKNELKNYIGKEFLIDDAIADKNLTDEEYDHYISLFDQTEPFGDGEINFDCVISAKCTVRYRPATHWQPSEGPEFEFTYEKITLK